MSTVAKPPPPRLPASGYVTASVKATATAASTAFPPAARISAAVSAPYWSGAATAAGVEWDGAGAVWAAAVPARRARPQAASTRAWRHQTSVTILTPRLRCAVSRVGSLAGLAARCAPALWPLLSIAVHAGSPRQCQKGRILLLVDRDVRQERHGSGSDARLPSALRHLPGRQELGAPRPFAARTDRKQA